MLSPVQGVPVGIVLCETIDSWGTVLSFCFMTALRCRLATLSAAMVSSSPSLETSDMGAEVTLCLCCNQISRLWRCGLSE